MSYHQVFEHYPYLRNEEFAEICHYLDSAYLRAELGTTRAKWQLEVVSHTDYVPFGLELMTSTYVRIRRPLEHSNASVDLAAELEQLSLAKQHSNPPVEEQDEIHDADMLQSEDADEVSGGAP
jgi:hypothetical protein